MRTYGLRKLVFGLCSLVSVFCFAFTSHARADATTVPWLSGTLMGNPDLFSVGSSWQDYSCWLSFSPESPRHVRDVVLR